MPEYTTKDIRNVALVGQSGAGKTTLIEALLYRAGAIQEQGSIEQGNTVCDFDPQEQQYRHSLNSALACADVDGVHINFLDTPGMGDFLGRSFGILQAAETSMIVINAETGLEPAVEAMMTHAEADKRCRVIVINKIDTCSPQQLEQLVQQIRETYGDQCLPLNLPSADGHHVVDCFFEPTGEATAFSTPEQAHTTLVDQIVEMDEKLMELYLEQGQELDAIQLHDPFEAALREGHLVPICFVSAKSGEGTRKLLKVITRLLPDPTEGNPPAFLKGEGELATPVQLSCRADDHVVAHVFKISNDPFRGKLGVFRIYQGTVTPSSQLFIGNARKAFKVGHLLRLHGKQQTEIGEAIPGDICAVSRVDDLERDAVLHDSHEEDHFHLTPEKFPTPLFGLALVATKHGDEQKLSDALAKLTAEDPCLVIEHDSQANETVIRGLGELHLRVVLEQLEQRYNVKVETHPPSIPYRETISGSAEGHHRHKKQTGGAGQFGEVFLRIEPLPRGEGFQYIDESKGGVIPGQFIPAIEKGIRQAMEEGFIAGYPIQDVKVTVYDGKFHSVDSKEIAFITAGKRAFQKALEQARPVVLEPIVELKVSCLNEHMGDITADLAGRRGRVSNTEAAANGRMLISALVPLAELEDYNSKLKAMSAGDASYQLEFNSYEPVPGNIQKALVERYQRPEQGDD